MMLRDELERIYDEHAPCAFALFHRFASCDADARDLLQDWLVKVARGHDSLDDIENERAYLMRIAYRHAVDWTRRVRSRRRTRDTVEEQNLHPTFSEMRDPDRDTIRQSLECSLAELPRDQQLAVQMKLWDGLTFAEIGEVLEISTNTAASRYRYGIEKMREALRPVYDELN
jgi:RNA polymerase sigma-70 factor (ECF subfamily)